MNRVSIVYLFAVLYLCVSPSLTAPADGELTTVKPDQSENEIDRGVETIRPVNENQSPEVGSPEVGPPEVGPEVAPEGTSTFFGVGSGVITRIGTDGPFECMSITCPSDALKCIYNSTYEKDGKTMTVEYKCMGSDDKQLFTTTKTEPVPRIVDSLGFVDLFKGITEHINEMFDRVLKSFRTAL